MASVNWRMFPTNTPTPQHIVDVASAFGEILHVVGTPENQPNSDAVLAHLRPRLETLGWLVESGKGRNQKLSRPVLFGENGAAIKSFDVDGYHAASETVLEVEAGRAVVNHQFLKDLFEACVIPDCSWLIIAVQNEYRPRSASYPQRDYVKVVNFMETLYASRRLALPLTGVAVVGY